jgi:hypothetical protein
MTFALWQAFAVGRSSRVTRRKAASDPLRNSTSIYECFSTHGNSGGGVCALLYGLSARPGTKYEKKSGMECRPIFAKTPKIVRQSECLRHSPTMSQTFSTKYVDFFLFQRKDEVTYPSSPSPEPYMPICLLPGSFLGCVAI